MFDFASSVIIEHGHSSLHALQAYVANAHEVMLHKPIFKTNFKRNNVVLKSMLCNMVHRATLTSTFQCSNSFGKQLKKLQHCYPKFACCPKNISCNTLPTVVTTKYVKGCLM